MNQNRLMHYLLLACLVFHGRNAHAGAFESSQAASMLGGVTSAVSTMNFMALMADMSCDAAAQSSGGTPCPAAAWQESQNPMAWVGAVGGIVGGVVAQTANANTAKQVAQGAGGADPSLDSLGAFSSGSLFGGVTAGGDKKTAADFGPELVNFCSINPTDASCAKLAEAKPCDLAPSLPLCTAATPAEGIEAMKDILRSLSDKGLLDTSQMSLDDALAQLDKTKLDLAAGVSMPSEEVNKQMEMYTAQAIASTQGWGGATEKKSMGPVNQNGLGLVNYLNGIDLEDAQSGKPLTLWQRATRRYMGTENKKVSGTRAYAMGKMEKLRNDALKWLNLARAEALKSQARAPSSVKAVSHSLK